jgi:hypothetical protein
MIASPSTPILYVLAAHIRSTVSSIGQTGKAAISGGRFHDWPALFLPTMAAIHGWLTIGLVPQSTLMVAAVLRRLSGKMRRHSAERTPWISDTCIRIPGAAPLSCDYPVFGSDDDSR